MAQITYANKVALNENPEIAAINKVSDDDMNEIKQVVNDNYNNTIQITDTQPTGDDWKLWIDTGEVQNIGSEITNEYSESTGIGYSANYINNMNTYSTTEHRVGTWKNGKPLYRKLIETTIPTTSTDGTFAYNETSLGTTNEFTLIELGYFVDAGSILPIPYFTNSGYSTKAFLLDANTLRINNSNSSWNGKNVSISILYTKTTD